MSFLEGMVVFFTKCEWIRWSLMKDCDWQFENNDLERIAVWYLLYLTSLAYAAFEARKQIDYLTIVFLTCCYSLFLKARDRCTCGWQVKYSSISKWKLVSLSTVIIQWFLLWRNKTSILTSICMSSNSTSNSSWRQQHSWAPPPQGGLPYMGYIMHLSLAILRGGGV